MSRKLPGVRCGRAGFAKPVGRRFDGRVALGIERGASDRIADADVPCRAARGALSLQYSARRACTIWRSSLAWR